VADGAERPRPRLGARLQARLLRAGRPRHQRRRRRQRVRAPRLHRGVPMLGGKSAGWAVVRLRSFKEMQIFNRRWEEAAAEDESWTDPYDGQPATASSR